MNISKLFLSLILTLFLFSESDAQTSSGSWTSLTTQNNVTVSYQATTCSSDTMIYIKIVNADSTNKTVIWNLWGETTSNSITVSGNQERSGSCASGPFLSSAIPSGKTIGDLNPNITVQ